MLIKIITVGKLKDRALQARCDEFAKWLGPYAKVEQRELVDSDVEREGAAINKELDRDRSAALIVLSEEGREFSSVAFAEQLGRFDRKVVFVIGGPYGLASAVKARADILWSLSKLTFTHEIARLLLYEQLFRAVNILHGGRYHNP
ncbi:MAG: 23S rRNA (pseudouridine(1915)-N(3))-methyltransferase RlmH [Lentisphaerae bacterium]|jgi:23S rRNA (pseudouridine1915-N3)-methyltransferase|nr:23S rRNA (pseudouridine(1915)-N(3))-methyltransferase RlmH [Lentisphaerota bacterium]